MDGECEYDAEPEDDDEKGNCAMKRKAMTSPWTFVPAMVVMLAAVSCVSLRGAEHRPPIRVLILSGQNNHDWTTTTPALRKILEDDGRFVVEITHRPDQWTDEVLSPYDLILSDWNTFGPGPMKDWPDAAKQAFLGFVRRGKGVVFVHAGSSSFYDWEDYQAISGANWKIGQTSHGAPHEFEVNMVGEHPITRGVDSFRTTDELWINPGVAPRAVVIAEAEQQPIALVTSHGKGRCFTLLLGHGAQFMETPGFKTLLLRGAEWAATGEVRISGT
jgi:uncharacterized protein